jgi:hypothetical protein
MADDNSLFSSTGQIGSPSNQSDPLGLTGMSSSQLSQGVLAGGSSSAPTSTDSVWVGGRALGRPTATRGHDTKRFSGITTYGQAQGLVGNWYANDQNYYKQFVNKLIMYKYPSASSDMGVPEAMSAWDDLLKMAITLNKSGDGKKNWTPWDVLESYNHKAGSMGTYKSGDWLIDAATGEKVKYVGPRTKTSKTTAVDLSSAEDVQAIATQVLTQMIGRAPTDKEMAKFKATLNGYENKHPEITTTTDTYDDMGNVSASNVVHSGGVDDAARQTLLGNQTKGTKEYAKYQGGTTYFNALMSMIGGS